ncbi:CHASE3 domain-containing protein [Novosphingobium sp. KCTC 2891]|uniref:sensor histidine kinase n=1 Tax=Novosphingobium sp. KCTC 2891 TaxID=2989730 RepID=UPI0022213A20|nr:CHASE3 domain-containing protein [Novosphingobium sp. KCTC 2891]MCW1383086.1 CHASE3 domain-containing protein [Novosphingobium sp. KCTC 2891]
MVPDPNAAPRPPVRWWQRAPRVPSLILFAVVAMALLGTFTMIFATVEAERVQRTQATRTSAVLAALNGLVSATINGETAQRGYFITNDRRYLEPYFRGREDYERQAQALRERIGDEATEKQTALLDEIDRLGDAKWAEMAGTVRLVEQGRIVDANTRILSDEGQLAMNDLRATVAKLEMIERVHLDEATQRAAAAEARVVPSLALLFVVIVIALVLGLWQAIRTARAEAAASNADAIAEARDRADILAKELNHRVKNLFAVILAIVKMSARGDAPAAPAVDRIAKRIHALVTAHDVTQGAPGESHVDIANLIGKAIAPYRSSSERCELTGGSLVISGRHAAPLGLVLHELVTNAVKYGAWASPGGLLRVDWRENEGRVRVVWEEHSDAPAVIPQGGKPGREGFGTMLIRSSERQLGGKITRRFESHGIVVEMDFPREG